MPKSPKRIKNKAKQIKAATGASAARSKMAHRR